MRFIHKIPLQARILSVIVFLSLVSMSLAFTLFDAHDRIVSHKTLVRNLATLADLLGDRSSAALLENDPVKARAALDVLLPHGYIQQARLYDANGTLVAALSREGTTSLLGDTSPQAEGYRFEGDYLLLSQPIIRNGEAIGSIFLQQVTDKFQSRLAHYAAIILAALVVILFLSLPISGRMTRWLPHQEIIGHPASTDSAETPRRPVEPSDPPQPQPEQDRATEHLDPAGEWAKLAGQAAEPEPNPSLGPAEHSSPIPVAPPVFAAKNRCGYASGGFRILLAEDNPVNQKVASIALQKQGHLVTIAANGRQAVDCFDPGAFDLIFMDLQMPELGGGEAAQMIREKERAGGGHVPIIAMTANDDHSSRDACLENGMDDFISKPIQVNHLLETVERIMSRKKPSNKSSSDAGQPPAPTSNLVDKQDLLGRVEGDAELLEEIVKAFLDDYPGKIVEIRRAIESRQAENLQRLAHSFKGSVGIFSKGAPFEKSKQLELLGHQGRFDDAYEQLCSLEKDLDQLEAELKAVISESAVPQP